MYKVLKLKRGNINDFDFDFDSSNHIVKNKYVCEYVGWAYEDSVMDLLTPERRTELEALPEEERSEESESFEDYRICKVLNSTEEILCRETEIEILCFETIYRYGNDDYLPSLESMFKLLNLQAVNNSTWLVEVVNDDFVNIVGEIPVEYSKNLVDIENRLEILDDLKNVPLDVIQCVIDLLKSANKTTF